MLQLLGKVTLKTWKFTKRETQVLSPDDLFLKNQLQLTFLLGRMKHKTESPEN